MHLLKVKEKMSSIFISLTNISAIIFQQPFSKNKIDQIIIYKVTIGYANCCMNHYHRNSYPYIV